MTKIRLGIIGLGYVGLTTAIAFSEKGYLVNIYDNDHKKIKNLKVGKSYYYEPGLDELLIKNIKKNSLIVYSKMHQFLDNIDVVFICVGTPTSDNGYIDLSYLEKVCDEIGRFIKSLFKIYYTYN